jgi:hypothetical protein
MTECRPFPMLNDQLSTFTMFNIPALDIVKVNIRPFDIRPFDIQSIDIWSLYQKILATPLRWSSVDTVPRFESASQWHYASNGHLKQKFFLKEWGPWFYVGERNWIQTRQSLKIKCFIFSVHTGLAQALSTMLGETTWISEEAKWAQQHHSAWNAGKTLIVEILRKK